MGTRVEDKPRGEQLYSFVSFLMVAKLCSHLHALKYDFDVVDLGSIQEPFWGPTHAKKIYKTSPRAINIIPMRE